MSSVPLHQTSRVLVGIMGVAHQALREPLRQNLRLALRSAQISADFNDESVREIAICEEPTLLVEIPEGDVRLRVELMARCIAWLHHVAPSRGSVTWLSHVAASHGSMTWLRHVAASRNSVT